MFISLVIMLREDNEFTTNDLPIQVEHNFGVDRFLTISFIVKSEHILNMT